MRSKRRIVQSGVSLWRPTPLYLDYRKAFDSVDHVTLIQKLCDNNINCKLIKWIAAFLQDRKMQVKVKLEFSDWAAVLSGVPQG